MGLCQSFQPFRHAGGYLVAAGAPSARAGLVDAEAGGQTERRPADRVETGMIAIWGHESSPRAASRTRTLRAK